MANTVEVISAPAFKFRTKVTVERKKETIYRMNELCSWFNLSVLTFLFNEKLKCSRYRPCVAQRVGRGLALLFHDRGTG